MKVSQIIYNNTILFFIAEKLNVKKKKKKDKLIAFNTL